MRIIAIIGASFFLASAALAQSGTTGATAGATCKSKASTTLHGAALTSTLKSCCKTAAADQKLHGAAEKSFRSSCEKAALGS
jgi:hypothetical protein